MNKQQGKEFNVYGQLPLNLDIFLATSILWSILTVIAQCPEDIFMRIAKSTIAHLQHPHGHAMQTMTQLATKSHVSAPRNASSMGNIDSDRTIPRKQSINGQ